MAGTKLGGQQTATTNKRRYGDDYYKRIGALGGAATYVGLRGFAFNRELAREAGRKGGRISRRPSKKEA